MQNVSRETFKPKMVAVIGPTASGKTALGVQLAEQVNGEIISVDSRQVFRGMDIGTGKDISEYASIPYHLIDIRNPEDDFAVSDFQVEGLQAVEKILNRGNTPIFAGGSAYYLKALIDDYQFTHDATDRDYTEKLEKLSRKELESKIQQLGIWERHHWAIDSKRRMARAIEKAEKNTDIKGKNDLNSFLETYDLRIFHTDFPADILRDRIQIRLNARFQEGMIDEVKSLLESGKVTKDRLLRFGLEYKWICLYLEGEISLDWMKQKLYTEICRFAKRQRTFLRYMQKQGHQLKPIHNREAWLQETADWLLM